MYIHLYIYIYSIILQVSGVSFFLGGAKRWFLVLGCHHFGDRKGTNTGFAFWLFNVATEITMFIHVESS